MQILMNFAALLMSGRDCGVLGYPMLDCLILLIHGIEAARSRYMVVYRLMVGLVVLMHNNQIIKQSSIFLHFGN